jgi:Uma2 family endonuclease
MATGTRARETGVKLYRLTVRQHLMMINAGVFRDGDHVELLGGALVEKVPKNPPHSIVLIRLSKNLYRLLPDPWFGYEGKPVQLGRFWYPEPDVAIIRGPDDLYQKRAPQAADVGFLIEVADSSYSIDRGEKWRAYAAARVAVYWIVNIQQRRIEVYTDPSGRGRLATYRQATTFNEVDMAPVVLDGQEVGRIAVGDISPQP